MQSMGQLEAEYRNYIIPNNLLLKIRAWVHRSCLRYIRFEYAAEEIWILRYSVTPLPTGTRCTRRLGYETRAAC
jgi:hypothetical protein